MRLLLVDDNAMNAELFVSALESDGHVVVVERDGAGGRTRALAEPFELLILDVQLPDISGSTVCRELRAAGVRSPIIALSAAALPDEISRGLAAGFDAYLTKPISPADLRKAVRKHASTREPV